MLLLTATTDTLELLTSVAATLDVHVSYVDLSGTTVTTGRQNTAITTATTTIVCAAPAASTTRNIKTLNVRNKHASTSCDVTVLFDQNATNFELVKVTLRAGETLEYVEGVGFFTVAGPSAPTGNQSTADQVTTAGTDTYLTGSSIVIPTTRPLAIGTSFHWRVYASKSAAGVAAWSMIVRVGTAGTVADTARLTFTQVTNVQTAVVDTGTWEVRTVVRGPLGASCIMAGGLEFQHHLATTGLSTVSGADTYQVTSGAFDSTTSGLIVGLSCNPGAAGVFTFQVVKATVENL